MAGNNKKSSAMVIASKIAKVNDLFRKANSKDLLKFDLTAPQFDSLMVIHTNGPIPLKKISEELMVTGANITCIIDNLEKMNYVKRVNSREDRRVVLAELTSKGKEKITKVLPDYLKRLSEVSGKLTQAESKQLNALLDKLLS